MSYQDPTYLPESALPPMPLSPADTLEVRLSFLRRTYGLLLLGWLVTGVGAVVALSVPVILLAVLRYIWIAFLVQIGLVIGAGLVSHRAPWNTMVYFGFAFVSGLILAPILLAVTFESGSFGIVIQAFGITTTIFVGLSAYSLVSRRDFSFLRGGLVLALFTLLGVGVLSIFLRSDALSLFFSSLAAIVFSGFILYDTSRMLRLAGQISPVTAALSLYLDFYNLFLAILRLLSRRR